ncbi:MAG: hypothetical protein ACJ75H_00375 [Thermoanaerobaculia bacterium]
MTIDEKAVRVFVGNLLPPDRHPVVVIETLMSGEKYSAQYFAFLRRDGSPPIIQFLSFDPALVELAEMFSSISAMDFVVEHARQRAEGELNRRAFAEFTGLKEAGRVFEPVRLEEKNPQELAHFLLSVDKPQAAAALRKQCRSPQLKRYLEALAAVRDPTRNV